MTILLRGGATTEDPKLDRVYQRDWRSLAFPIADVVTAQEAERLRSYTWRCDVWNDQGQEGACVGFGWAHELAARPAVERGVSADLSRGLYWKAQQADEWEGGSYEGAAPFYEGSSVLAGAKVVHGLGYIEQYRWALNLHDLIVAVGYKGPAVVGFNWYSGMFDTDADGFVRATGSLQGGHCLLVTGVDVKRRRFRLHNSWGKGWGVGGDCFLSFDDADRLLHEDGEACIPLGRRRPKAA